MISVRLVADYSQVTAGFKKFIKRKQLEIRAAFKVLAKDALVITLEELQASYKNPKSYKAPSSSLNKVRAGWTRSGNLQRAIILSKDGGRSYLGGWISGVGEFSVLDAAAPYWGEIEEGTTKYLGLEKRGFFTDQSGVTHAPSSHLWGQHKWTDAAEGNCITIRQPIMAHRYFKSAAKRIDDRFRAIMGPILRS